jgi:ABC-2 type transport system ATP-binding protein
MRSEKVSIHLREISKKLGPNQALSSLSLDFESGAIHGIVGPDGAGKTTLLRSLVGLLSPDQGTIQYRVDGKAQPWEYARQNVGYLSQQASLYADLSVREHLEFFRSLFQIPEKEYHRRSKELLDMTRLAPFEDRRADQLSGGMYKKLGLMCTLLRPPSVLLLDEPTNGVDPISRREFWTLLHLLQEQGVLVILATAYMDEAERCGKVHLLEKGTLLAAGEPRALLAANQARSVDELFLKRSEQRDVPVIQGRDK